MCGYRYFHNSEYFDHFNSKTEYLGPEYVIVPISSQIGTITSLRTKRKSSEIRPEINLVIVYLPVIPVTTRALQLESTSEIADTILG